MITPAAPSPDERALLEQAYRLHRAGRLVEAEVAYVRYVGSHPSDTAALNNLGALQLQSGNAAAAARSFDGLCSLQPDNAIAHCNLGFALTGLGKYAEAERHLRMALALQPGSPLAHNNLGVLLAASGRKSDAIREFEATLGGDPHFVDALVNLGNLHMEDGRLDAADALYARVLDRDSTNEPALLGRARIAASSGHMDPAIAMLTHLVSVSPASAPAWRALGESRLWMAQPDAAELCYRRALEIAGPAGEWGMGLAASLLSRGRFEDGWREFEKRPYGYFGGQFRFAELPPWDGKPLAAGTLVLHCEQGLGDVIQFMRFIPLARERVGRILILLDEYWQSLAPLFRSIDGIDAIIIDAASLPSAADPRFPVAAQCSVLSLPWIFATSPDSIPSGPYLKPPADRIEQWRKRLAGDSWLRVGLAWEGSPRLGNLESDLLNRRRSIALSMLSTLAGVPDITFYSLQKEAGPRVLGNDSGAKTVIDCSDELSDMADTAALIANLDLVISVDTSVVHLAGALGRPVWMLNRFDSDWRWGYTGETSPWYPSIRIFRQHRFMDWSNAIDDARDALEIWAAKMRGRIRRSSGGAGAANMQG